MTNTKVNRELMDRYMAAWQSGDIAGVQACYREDVVMHVLGRSGHAGTYYGLTEWTR